MSYFIIANSILISFSLYEILNYLTLFDNFGLLMILLQTVTYQLKYFMVLFILVILLFSGMFQTFGIEIDVEEFPDIDKQFKYIY
jgi:hypothetical protein